MHICMNIESIINDGFTSFLNKPLQDVDIKTIHPTFINQLLSNSN